MDELKTQIERQQARYFSALERVHNAREQMTEAEKELEEARAMVVALQFAQERMKDESQKDGHQDSDPGSE